MGPAPKVAKITIPKASTGRVTRPKKGTGRSSAKTVKAKGKTAKNGSNKPPTNKSARANAAQNTAPKDSEFDYEEVEANWDTRVEYSIVAETTSGSITMEGSVNGTGPLKETSRIEKLFNGATTHNLTLNMKDKSDDAAAYYTTIFTNLKYENLSINFEGENDHSKFFKDFLPSIINGRNLSNGKLALNWKCDRPQTLLTLRHTLKIVPKVNELEIGYCIKDKSGTLLDDATLRHLVANSSDAKLNNADNVTAQGVLDAFEEVCKASDDKLVMMNLKDSLVDQVFTIGAKKNGWQMNSTVLHRRLKDTKRGKMLVEWGKSSTGYTPIVIQSHQDTPTPLTA